MNATSISWTEKTWNPMSGCTPISEGCANCYAKRMAQRLRGRCGYPADEPFRVTLHEDKLNEPLRMWKPARVFVASMGDLFHEDVPDEFIDKVFAVMALAPWHSFLVLTKRPERMRLYALRAAGRVWNLARDMILSGFNGSPLPAYEWKGGEHAMKCDDDWPLPNVWAGVTAENQARADERIPVLLQTPAAVRFVSVEPMLGLTDLRHLHYQGITEIDALAGTHGLIRPHGGKCAKLGWVVCGGETGPGARPMRPDWVRGLRDQCQAAGVPFHFKSWGQWAPERESDTFDEIMDGETTCPVCGCTDSRACDGGCYWIVDADNRDRCSRCAGVKSHGWPDGSFSYRVGPKAAGRLLDGKAWDEYPEVRSGE